MHRQQYFLRYRAVCAGPKIMLGNQDESSNSTSNCSRGSFREILTIECSLFGAGVVICVISIISTVALKLHKQLVYRLSIYQVVSALAYGVVSFLDVLQSSMMDDEGNIYSPICLLNAFSVTYTLLVKAFLATLLTVHLFLFSMCYTNFRKLEVFSLVIALVVPAIMAAVPFTTNTYGQQVKKWPWCGIQQHDFSCPPGSLHAGIVEIIVLWYVPLGVCFVSMVLMTAVMLSVLTLRASRLRHHWSLKNREALMQMLPLIAFPVSFCVLEAIMIIHFAYDTAPRVHKDGGALVIVDQVMYSLVVWTSGIVLLWRVLLVMRNSTKKKSVIVRSEHITEGCRLLNEENNAVFYRSSTYFSAPVDS